MLRNQNILWWIASCKGEPVVYHVFAAHTIEAVHESLGDLYQNYNISQATWSALFELTGCVIPSSKKPTDFATGYIMVYHEPKFICFTVAG